MTTESFRTGPDVSAGSATDAAIVLGTSDESLFLVELRMAQATFADGELLATALAVAGERASAHGRAVQVLAAAYLPEDLRVVCLVEASSIEVVEALLTSASLSTSRVSRAVPVAHLDPRRGAT